MSELYERFKIGDTRTVAVRLDPGMKDVHVKGESETLLVKKPLLVDMHQRWNGLRWENVKADFTTAVEIVRWYRRAWRWLFRRRLAKAQVVTKARER